MPYITQIDQEKNLAVAMHAFAEGCHAYAATLGLDAAELAEIDAMAADLQAAIESNLAAKAQAASAQTAKDAQLKKSKEVLAKWANTFRANATVPDNVLTQLQLASHRTPATRTKPEPPRDLVATSDGQGLVTLRWHRNGNREGTVFTVEVRHPLSFSDARSEPALSLSKGAERERGQGVRVPDDWRILGATTQTKFTYQARLGETITFRVTASRGDRRSSACTPASLWSSTQLRAA